MHLLDVCIDVGQLMINYVGHFYIQSQGHSKIQDDGHPSYTEKKTLKLLYPLAVC